MGKRFYKFSIGAIRLFSHRMKTEWEVPFEEGPCVFVVNNVGFMGPIEMCAKFAERNRCHPWIDDELQEAKKTLAAQKSQLDKVTEENSELTNKIENSEQEKQIRWAKVGALLVGFGLLAGVILVYLPRPHRRRKDIW